MALDREPMKLLSQKLVRGYYLNDHLQTLLGRHPMDSRSQEEAMAVSQEVSRVFTEAMAMLQHASSCGVDAARVAPEMAAGNSIGLITPAKEKRIREEEIPRWEVTPSPHKDGYQWKKYGQKNIQNRSFPRYYFKCNRHRRCEAKKKVQQQDTGRGHQLPPMFEVTYANEHTCHVLRANDDDNARIASHGTTSRGRHHALAGVVDTARSDEDLSRHGGSGGRSAEDEAMVSCLAAVISGTVPPPSPSPSSWWTTAPEASASDGAAFMPRAPAGHSASASLDGSVEDDGAMIMMMMDAGFPSDTPSFCPVEEAVGHHYHHRDMHMDVARFADTVWPQQQNSLISDNKSTLSEIAARKLLRAHGPFGSHH